MDISVLVPLAPGFEELEAVSATDLFTRAGFKVTTAGTEKRNIKASRGLNVVADTVLEEIKDQSFDAIVLPGGLPGADFLRDSQILKEMLLKQHQQKKLIGAICAAPKVLVAHGIITDQGFSAYPGSQSKELNPEQLLDHVVCIDGHIVTSRGPGTAMDFALEIIELLSSAELREEVEDKLVR